MGNFDIDMGQISNPVHTLSIDVAYGKTAFKTDAERTAFLFELYQ